MGDATEPLLVVDNQTVEIATPAGPIRPVDGISFTLEKGETLGVVGESGSGKSMLVRSLMGLLPTAASLSPDSSVRFDGRDLRLLPRAERRHFWGTHMAMIFQDPMTSLNPTRTVGAQLTDPLRYHLGLSAKAARHRAVELLDRVRIPESTQRLDQFPHELSGGMRQRVTIAIALSCDPELLIADEPTTALDVTVQKQILELLDDLQRAHDMAMILISHDLGVVTGHTDRIAVMYAGRVVESGVSGTIEDQAAHPYTRALLDSIPRLDQPGHTRLAAIEGRPPDLARLPAGCAFAERCPRASDLCRETIPVLDVLEAGGHRAACHHPLVAGPDLVAPGSRAAGGH